MTHILRISTWLAETYMLDNLTSENIVQLVQVTKDNFYFVILKSRYHWVWRVYLLSVHYFKKGVAK